MVESLKQDNRPSVQFYPEDWLMDPGLRLCSLAAQGLWILILCVMWLAKPRGTLSVNEKPLDNKGLTKIVGRLEGEVNKLVAELEDNGVFSRMPDGTIYCRRMYREWQKPEHIKKVRSEAGKKGMASRWGADNKNITKITASTSSSTSLNNRFDNNKPEEKSTLRKGEPRHISHITPDVLKTARGKISDLPESPLKGTLKKIISKIEEEETVKTLFGD